LGPNDFPLITKISVFATDGMREFCNVVVYQVEVYTSYINHLGTRSFLTKFNTNQVIHIII